MMLSCFLQHAGLVEALHAEVTDTVAALEQLQQERMSHADFVVAYADQVRPWLLCNKRHAHAMHAATCVKQRCMYVQCPLVLALHTAFKALYSRMVCHA